MKVYMIGIGGSSMQGLCEILLEKDMDVSGSDPNGCGRLESMGVKVYREHKSENIADGTQIVIYSSAVKEDNPELVFARENHICIFSRGELLGLISRGFEKSVCVSGSHGKTTTTAMIGEIFAFAGKNASVHFGGEGGRRKCGNGKDIFLCEACEYKDNFLNLAPFVGCTLNMEFDHPDYFKTKAQLEASFHRFASGCKVFLSTKKVARQLDISDCITCEVIENESETEGGIPYFSARKLREEKGCYTFDFYKKTQYICEISLRILGKFNVENALFACAISYLFSATPYEIQKGISSFFGVKRRLEKLPCSSCEIYCDYAHHPTQIDRIFEIFQDRNVLCIFQPHTYSRTKSLLEDFVSALSRFQHIAILPTYPAREKFEYKGSGQFLASNIPHAIFLQEEMALGFAKKNADKTLLFLGAGDIEEIARDVSEEISKRNKPNVYF